MLIADFDFTGGRSRSPLFLLLLCLGVLAYLIWTMWTVWQSGKRLNWYYVGAALLLVVFFALFPLYGFLHGRG